MFYLQSEFAEILSNFVPMLNNRLDTSANLKILIFLYSFYK